MAALMFVASGAYAAETINTNPPTGPQAQDQSVKTDKKMARGHKDKKKKRTKPLTPAERADMERRQDTTVENIEPGSSEAPVR